MALDEAIIYATYEDDGSDGPGSQNSTSFPTKSLLIFKNMSLAHEYDLALRMHGNGRKNPRITAFYSQDRDEISLSCYPVKIIEPILYRPINFISRKG